MAKWKSIDELRGIFIRKYENSELGSELEKACSEEYELMRDYNGRQILELLQNVDDAYVDKKDKDIEDVAVSIIFKNNILEVGNTGTTFSADTIERLCLGRASDKSSKNIGNKGTGFRSLLNDAEWIEIYSGNFSIRFSEKYTKSIFEESCNRSPLIRQQKENWKKDYSFCFPIMNCPEQIEKKDDNKFDTLIRVKIKDENTSKDTSIEKQLQQSFYKSLIFLPNITKIYIETENVTNNFEKIVNHDEVRIKNSNGGFEEYYVYSKSASIGNKTANIIIAIPKNKQYDFSKETLYCYFPIRNFQTPVHALIHAPFITNNSRDDIPNDNEEINKRIFKEIIQFIKEVSEKDISKKDTRTLAIEVITSFEDNKLWKSDFFNFKDYYYCLMRQAKILPTKNGKFISIEDNPKLFENDYPSEFCGSEFDNLLEPLNKECSDFVRKLANTIDCNISYNWEELLGKINKIGLNWNIEIQVKIFLWWSEYYKDYNLIPNLLKDSKGNWLMKDDKDVYLPTNTGICLLPDALSSWVKLCILRQDYVDELIKQLKLKKKDEWKELESKYEATTGGKRILATYSKYLALNFTEQSSSDSIIRLINGQIDSLEKSKSFINWFYNKYKNSFTEDSVLSKIPFKLPNKNYEIKSIRDLYLGKNYGNLLAEKLFDKTSYSSLLNLRELYEGSESDGFIAFLKKCGIISFPKVIDDSDISNRQFLSFVCCNYFPYMRVNYLTSKNIPYFERLISELSMQEIKDWLSKDEKLKNLLLSQERNSYIRGRSNGRPLCFPSNTYIKFVLNNTAWIELEGKKYSPSKIIKYGKLKNKIDGYYGISEQDLIKELGKDIAISFNLDFKESFGNFSETDIKTIIDTLPSFDKGEISRKLYLDIIKSKKDVKPISTYSTANFSLLAQDGNFYPNRNLKYSDKKVPYLDKNKERFIAIPTKQSVETIEKWLGVQRYKSNIVLTSHTLMEDAQEFQNEITDIKIAILSCIDQNPTNVSRIKSLRIEPCLEITVKDTEKEIKQFDLEDYFFVEREKMYYLKVPNVEFSITELRSADGFANSILDIFKQVLTLDLDSNLVALLVSKNQAGKKKKIKDEYGIDQWNTSCGLLFNRNYINTRVLEFFKSHNLAETVCQNIASIDFSSLSQADFNVLREALKSVSLDISDLNNSIDNLNLDIRNFLKLEYEKFKNSKYEIYKFFIYKELKEKSFDEKKQFLGKLDSYKNYFPSEEDFDNSINVSIEEKLKQTHKFSINENSFEEVDIDGVYNTNANTIKEELKITKEDFDFFIQKYSDKSILYFDIPNNLCDEIKQFLKKEDSIHQNAEIFLNQKETITIKTRLEKPPVGNPQGECRMNGEKSQRVYNKYSEKKELAGKTAEQIAYRELKKQYSGLIWHSKNSEVPSDRNDLPPSGIVCDMWVRGKENLYFEIKSAIDEFQMSLNEYNSMKNNQNNYEVVLVNRESAEISRHKFGELEQFKQVNEYLFRFKQVKEGNDKNEHQ